MKILKKFLSGVIFLVFSLILGFIFGYILDNYMDGTSMDNVFFLTLTLVIAGLMILFLHIIIHELGHLILGLISGYSFVSFRVGSITLIREEGKFQFKKYNIPGTAGQCLMMPPEMKDGEFPFIIYNLGGALFNLIVAISCILYLIYAHQVDYPMNLIFVLSGFIGVIIGLSNGIPLKIGGISNDGSNILSMLKDQSARRAFYVQLRVNGLQSKGIRIKDIPFETFRIEEDSDLSNPLNTAMVLLQYNWYLDHLDMENAKETLERLVPHLNQLIPLYVYEINCERIFMALVTDGDRNRIDRLYHEGLQRYIKKAKFMISKSRLLLTYEWLYKDNREKALEYYNKMVKAAKQYPVKGDADMEMMLADYVMDIKKHNNNR